MPKTIKNLNYSRSAILKIIFTTKIKYKMFDFFNHSNGYHPNIRDQGFNTAKTLLDHRRDEGYFFHNL